MTGVGIELSQTLVWTAKNEHSWAHRNPLLVRFPRRKRRRGVGGDELNWVNLGRVDPATLQATKIARGVKTCV